MTMFQRKAIEKKHAEIEAGADKWLNKLILSKWTAPILIGGGLILVLYFLIGIF